MAHEDYQPVENDWVSFPGGELEGQRPGALCPACRKAREQAASARRPVTRNDQSGGDGISGGRLLCFQCYRAGLDRNRALRAAAVLNTASEERFQAQLPFETVDKPRLQMLKAARSRTHVVGGNRPDGFADRRRRAQMAARHALQAAIALGHPGDRAGGSLPDRARAVAAAIHAAELQLPESWIPFVVAG
jgi:hypothetical protein